MSFLPAARGTTDILNQRIRELEAECYQLRRLSSQATKLQERVTELDHEVQRLATINNSLRTDLLAARQQISHLRARSAERLKESQSRYEAKRLEHLKATRASQRAERQAQRLEAQERLDKRLEARWGRIQAVVAGQADARAIGLWCATRRGGYSVLGLARHLGRHHSTIQEAVRRVEASPELRARAKEALKQVSRTGDITHEKRSGTEANQEV